MTDSRLVQLRRLLAGLLVVGIVFGTTTLARADDEPADFKTLNKQFHKAHAGFDYKKALELAEQMHELRPDDVNARYNVACMHCLLGHKKDAYVWLDKAVDAGYSNADFLLHDDDFKTIRAEDRFRAIVKALRSEADEKADKSESAAKPEKAAKKTKGGKPKKPDQASAGAGERINKVNQLTDQLIKASKAGERKKALKLALKAHGIFDSGLTNYNVACMYVLLENEDKAFEYLDRAAGMGFGDIGQNLAVQMDSDSDLDFLRDDPRYDTAYEQAKKTEKAFAKKAARAKAEKTDKKVKKVKKDKKAKKAKKAKKEQGSKASCRDDKGVKKPDPELQKEVQKEVQGLTQKAIGLTQAGKYKEALKLAKRARELHNSGLTNYNIACIYALMEKPDKAFKYLNVAARLGFGDFSGNLVEQMENDSDLDSLRDDPRYAKALKKARKAGKTDKPEQSDKPKKSRKPRKPTEQDMSAQDRAVKSGRLTQELIAAAQAGKLDKALELALEADDLVDSGLSNYNVACMYSLLKETDKAFEYLDLAAGRGFNVGGRDMATQMERDSDLDFLRDDPRYAKALKKTREHRTLDRQPLTVGSRVANRWKATAPKAYDGETKLPLLVVLHGYAGNMEEVTDTWKAAADKAGVILLAPQGMWQLDDDGEQFHWGRDMDTIEENVMESIDMAMDEYEIDDENIILAGFSQGGWATWSLALRSPDTFAGIIPVGGLYEPESSSVYEDEDLASLRIFIMIGGEENDRLIDANKKAAKQFKKLGAKIKLNIYDGLGHAYPDDTTPEQVRAIRFILND